MIELEFRNVDNVLQREENWKNQRKTLESLSIEYYARCHVHPHP
jgi:hypothetical protein